MILNANNFQRITDLKIQKSIYDGTFGISRENIGKFVTEYIQNIPFSRAVNIYDCNAYANAKMAKDNFVSYWARVLGLNEDRKRELECIWQDAIYREEDCQGAMMPVFVLEKNGVMTQDSFIEAIYRVCNC